MKTQERVQQIIAEKFVDSFKPPHQEGPDYVRITDKKKTWKIDDAVQIQISEDSEARWPPVSIISLLRKIVNLYPDRIALSVKRNEKWEEWTYTQYLADVRAAAKGYLKLGLQPFKAVCILSYNCPEWFIGFLGAIWAGGVGVGIYTTNSPDACFHCLQDSEANILLVENDEYLKKILPFWVKMPNLKAIIQLDGKPNIENILSWEDLIQIGRSVPHDTLERRIKSLAVNQCCCLVYTSGTIGAAKGVMLTHDNITFFCKYVSFNVWKFSMSKQVRVSYLPLSHIAALNGDIFGGMVIAARTIFAPHDALKGKLGETLRETRPHVLVGVPRVWEKMYEKVKESEAEMPPTKKRVFAWARNQAITYYAKKAQNQWIFPTQIGLAKSLVLCKVRRQMGLQRCAVTICGGAPLSKDILDYFLSLDILITECYGLSETSGPHSIHLTNDWRAGSVGRMVPEFHVKIDRPDEIGRGEVLLKGRNVFMGYLNLPDKTNEALKDDGWFRSGDIGYLDADQYLFITGRIKELLVTSGGENVAPLPIENAIKKLVPIINNCMVIGDQKKYLSLLLTLKCQIDLDTLQPLDNLTPDAVSWCKGIGSSATTVSEIVNTRDPAVFKAMEKAVNEYNSTIAVSNAQKIQKWTILPKDFSIPGGEIGPSLKLVRHHVLKKHETVISKMYD